MVSHGDYRPLRSASFLVISDRIGLVESNTLSKLFMQGICRLQMAGLRGGEARWFNPDVVTRMILDVEHCWSSSVTFEHTRRLTHEGGHRQIMSKDGENESVHHDVDIPIPSWSGWSKMWCLSRTPFSFLWKAQCIVRGSFCGQLREWYVVFSIDLSLWERWK